MQEYGLYLTYAASPLFRGTIEECKARVSAMTDAQREHGYTIAPIPPEPYTGPYVDPVMVRRVWILTAAFMVMALLLALTVWTSR